ncbi:MAG: ABC transporter permease [Truepera sp.]|nr:ABC transporter permease [Truepera sp.]
MTLLKEYIIPRLFQTVVVIFVGITLTFFIPRLSPISPVDQMLGRLSAFQVQDPRAVMQLRETLIDLYGLEGSIFTQYFNYWKRLLQFDLGPSFYVFPTPVAELIGDAIWWTVGLLLVSTIISWFLGLILGTMAGYFPDRVWSRVLDSVLITIYPTPYVILAILLVFLFAFIFPIFPLVGGASGRAEFTLSYLVSILFHGFLPALSLLLGATAFRFIIAKALTTTERASDYVQYAEMAALPKRKILFFYVARNTLLPQVTDLGLSFGTIFGGALITEVIFSYPGIGFSLLLGINNGDFNLIMGITVLSVIGIAVASLIVDLTYPLFDPRVRYK